MTKLSHVINCSNNELALTNILFPIEIFSYLTIVIKIVPVNNMTSRHTNHILAYCKMFINISTQFRVIKFYY